MSRGETANNARQKLTELAFQQHYQEMRRNEDEFESLIVKLIKTKVYGESLASEMKNRLGKLFYKTGVFAAVFFPVQQPTGQWNTAYHHLREFKDFWTSKARGDLKLMMQRYTTSK